MMAKVKHLSNDEMRQTRVRIVNRDHPHYRETGFLTGKVIKMRFSDAVMAEMKLEDCPHKSDACFISPGDIERDRLQ